MELQVTGTNMELTPAVRRRIERKLGNLDKHLPSAIETRVEIAWEKTKSPQQHYLVRVTVGGGVGGAAFHGEERAPDVIQAIDRVAAVMVRQLEHHKGKLYEKGRGNPAVRGEAPAGDAAPAVTGRVVKTKRFAVKPMSLEEATAQMQLLGHSFFLFFDADAEEVKLLYRRHDGNFGLIEPEFS